MFCWKCGTEIEEGAKFCQTCGNKITEPVSEKKTELENLSLEMSDSDNVEIASQKMSRKKALKIIPIFLVGVVVIGGGIFLKKHQKSNSQRKQSDVVMTTMAPTMSPEEQTYLEAKELLEAGEFEAASEKFLSLGTYMNAVDEAMNARYQQAMVLFTAEKYKKAKKIFQQAGGYGDSKEKIKVCNYNIAKNYFDKEKYAKAKKIFRSLGSYMDSKYNVHRCKVKAFQKEKTYIYQWEKIYDSMEDPYAMSDGKEYAVSWETSVDVDGYEVYVGQCDVEGNGWYEETFTTTDTWTSVQFSCMYQLRARVRPYKYIDGDIVYGQWTDTQIVTFY